MNTAVRLLFLWATFLAVLAVVLAVMSAAPETFAQTTPIDYDENDDNLIEIANLERLNAVRWDLDGDGASDNDAYTDAFSDAAPGMGCPDTCLGYELDANLDFDADGSYANPEANKPAWTDPAGNGWLPIGDSSNAFAATFEGNGYTISNLFINRSSTDYTGLFGYVSSGGGISNLGVVGVDVTGRDEVGGLVGGTEGTITGSYATSGVSSSGGRVGGLVGGTEGTITGSYATGRVSSPGNTVGGLAGYNRETITASYATGGVSSSGNTVGGLVGLNNGTITASYATGRVGGASTIGGLVGHNNVTITASYFDTDTSGLSAATGNNADSGGAGKATGELQMPTGYSGIYAAWNVDLDDADGDGDPATGGDDPWDFGEEDEYPALLTVRLGVRYDADRNNLIEISTLEQLNAVRWDLDGDGYADDGSDAALYAAAFSDAAPGMGCPDTCLGYELDANLDFDADGSYANPTVNKPAWTDTTGAGWMPIRDSSYPFAATFEGNGYTISNLFINRSSTDYTGLFGYVSSGGGIRNLGVVGVDVTGRRQVGGLAGRNNGTITASYATGVVSGSDNRVGGLVGYNDGGGSITGSYATGGVSGVFIIGGLSGGNNGSITGSYATGVVSGSVDYVGGLAGLNNGSITGSYATGVVSGASIIGGLAGVNNGSITGSYATGGASGSGIWVGGLAGLNWGGITGSYATGGAIGSADYSVKYVGGLVGGNNGNIIGSYATGGVSGTSVIGGLSGYNGRTGRITGSYATGGVSGVFIIGGLSGYNGRGGSITASYATGGVSGSGSRVGGLVGANLGTITASYFDTYTSGLSAATGNNVDGGGQDHRGTAGAHERHRHLRRLGCGPMGLRRGGRVPGAGGGLRRRYRDPGDVGGVRLPAPRGAGPDPDPRQRAGYADLDPRKHQPLGARAGRRLHRLPRPRAGPAGRRIGVHRQPEPG